MTTRVVAVAWWVLLQLIVASSLPAQSILNMPSSPEANGRGGLYLSSNTDDPLAPLSNPGLLGFLVQRNGVSVGFYPSATRWVPAYASPNDVEDAVYNYTGGAFNFGVDLTTLRSMFAAADRFSVGLGYQEVSYTYAYNDYTFQHPHSIVTDREKVRSVSLGVGYHDSFLQAGLGMNLKSVKINWSERKTDFTAGDFGLVLQPTLERAFWRTDSSHDWIPLLRPMISYTLRNVGSQFRYGVSTIGQPLPRSSALGLSLTVGLRAQAIENGNVNIIALSVGEQISDNLIGDNGNGQYMSIPENPESYPQGYYYKNPFGDLQPFNDLVLGKPHGRVSRQQGIELSVLETGYLRWGHVRTSHDLSGGYYYEEQYTTNGFGIRLSGVLNLFAVNQAASKSAIAALLTHHLDIQYQYSSRQDDSDYRSIQDGTTFHEIVLLWK